MVFKHAAPVESVLPLPSGTTLLSSAGNSVSVLDLVAARPLTTLRAHQKTVTSLSLASGNTRVLSAGLDGHVKVYDTASWSVVAGLKYPAPILSMTVIPSTSSSAGINPSDLTTRNEDAHIAIGLSTGILSLKTLLSPQQKTLQKSKSSELNALASGTIAAYDASQKRKAAKEQRTSGVRKKLRGLEYHTASHAIAPKDEADIVIEGAERRKAVKLQPWDKALRATRYAEALDLALAHTPPSPPLVVTVLQSLTHRSALKTALKNRDEISVQPVLKWVIKHLSDARYIELTARVATLLLELYGAEFGEARQEGGRQSERKGEARSEVAGLLERLHDKVRGQVEGSQAAWATKGMLDVIMLGAG